MAPTNLAEAPTENGPEYAIEFRIRNGPLLRAIRALGAPTMKAVAATAGMNITTIYYYLAFKKAPMNSKGEWLESALKLANALRVTPESIFPPDHRAKPLGRNRGEISMTSEDLRQLIEPDAIRDPEQLMQDEQLRARLLRVLSTLPPQEERVLRARFGIGCKEQTYREIAETMGVCHERVRQHERRGLLRLAGPSRREMFKPVMTVPPLRERPPSSRHYIPTREG